MKIKEGNDCKLKILVKDNAGTIIDNLAAAPDIVCHIKTSKDATEPTIEKKKSDSEILVNDPSTGYLKIIIKDTDTQNKSGDYFIGVEVQWVDNNQEMDLYEDMGNNRYRLFDTLKIIKDVVKPSP